MFDFFRFPISPVAPQGGCEHDGDLDKSEKQRTAQRKRKEYLIEGFSLALHKSPGANDRVQHGFSRVVRGRNPAPPKLLQKL